MAGAEGKPNRADPRASPVGRDRPSGGGGGLKSGVLRWSWRMRGLRPSARPWNKHARRRSRHGARQSRPPQACAGSLPGRGKKPPRCAAVWRPPASRGPPLSPAWLRPMGRAGGASDPRHAGRLPVRAAATAQGGELRGRVWRSWIATLWPFLTPGGRSTAYAWPRSTPRKKGSPSANARSSPFPDFASAARPLPTAIKGACRRICFSRR